MAEYYYSKNPHVHHQVRRWTFKLLGNVLHFMSDNGVFSKYTVDYGSRVIIKYTNVDEMPKGAVLDLGCGYGPIGIALAKAHPDRNFVLTDVNNLALKLARKNVKLNHLSNVPVGSSNVYDNIDQKFAGIVTNPPIRAGKKIVMAMLTGAQHYLVPNGTLTAVVRRKQGEPSAKRAMTKTYGNCQIVKRDKGYYVLKSVYRG
ncbi:MAG: class I SAM-dependent methyltransferase [Acetilactobacillus jinshanensis]